MECILREEVKLTAAKGRVLNKVFGKTGAKVETEDMIAVFARYSPEYGVMESHYHETEYMYVIDAKDAVVSYGDTLEDMDRKRTLKKGDILRPHEGEWHRFDFTSSDGFVDFLNFFAVPESHVVTDE